jgi:hypothetical protein
MTSLNYGFYYLMTSVHAFAIFDIYVLCILFTREYICFILFIQHEQHLS